MQDIYLKFQISIPTNSMELISLASPWVDLRKSMCIKVLGKSVNIKNKLVKQLSTTDMPHFYLDDFFLDQHGRSVVSLFLVKVSPHQISRSKTLTSSHLFS